MPTSRPTAAVLPQLTATVSPADLAAAVDELGAAIVTGFVDEATRAQIDRDLRPWIAATPAGSRSGDPEWESFHGARTVRLNGLAGKSPAFLDLATHPTVLAWAERSLVPDGGAIQVNDTQAIVIGPGERAQYLHRDQSAWPWFNQLLPDGPEVTVVAMVAMTDFTADNGATRVVPFSHLRPDAAELFDPAAAVPVEMPAGSLLVFSGRTIHGGGANVTAHEHRAALHVSYALGWLRSEEAHPFAIPLEVAASMPAAARTLFGFGQYDPAPADGGRLWLVDFEDPARTLFADKEITMTTFPGTTDRPAPPTVATGRTAEVRARRRDGTTIELDAATIDAFVTGHEGEVLCRGDAGYDEARRVWNGMIDRRPALVVRCASTDDVVHAIELARAHDIVMSVRGGGHNAAGTAIVDDGIVVDLSTMQRVEVDVETATVRAEGGVTIGALDAATQPHGLAVPMGVVTETGIAGLTLGGGYGWLRRKYGLSCDNLVAAEVVTADGRVVRASEQENPELLWGLRGGGGNLGVVTSFELRAHPVGPDVYFAVVMHAGTDAVEALRFYREWAATAPDEISSIAVLWQAPAIDEIPAEHHGRPIATFVAMHSGAPTDGEPALAPLRTFGDPIADLSGVMPFLEVQQFFDEDYPKWERRYYWTSAYVTDLGDELITELVRLSETMPSHHSNIDVWQGGGAPARVPADATAMGDRSSAFMLGIEANWDFVPADAAAGEQDRVDATNIEWARSAVRSAAPWATGTRYANFPGLYEDDERPDFFGPNRRRLAALKAAFDPENRFDRNHDLEPPAAP